MKKLQSYWISNNSYNLVEARFYGEKKIHKFDSLEDLREYIEEENEEHEED